MSTSGEPPSANAATAAGAPLWCSGLPLVDARPLTDPEVTELHALNRHRTRTGCVVALLSPLLFYLVKQVNVQEWVDRAPLTAGTLGAVLFFALVVVVAELLQTPKQNQRDLEHSTMWVFRGRMVSSAEMHRPLRRPGLGRLATVEVLAASRRLWSVDGQRANLRRMRVQEAVLPPDPDALPAVVRDEPLPSSHDPASQPVGWRPMTPAERDEARRRARVPVIVPSLHAVFFSVLGIAVYLAAVAGPNTIHPARLVLLGVLVGLALWSDARLVLAIRDALRVRADALQGRVLRTRRDDPELAHALGLEQTWVPLEILPNSRFVWTVAGRPTPWRT